MAITAYVKYGLIGGAPALDGVDGAGLLDGDVAFAYVSGFSYFYVLDDDIGGAESSPDKITPDANAGNKRWILQGIILPNAGLKVLDTNGSHCLVIKPGSDLSAERILTITTGDAARTLTLAGDLTTAGDVSVSTFGATVIDDADAAAALTTLGVSTYAKTLLDDANAATAVATLGFTATAAEVNTACDGLVGVLKAWVNFNGTGVVAINASGNVTSVTDNATGDYTINFTADMADINYSYVVNSAPAYGSEWLWPSINTTSASATESAPLVGSCRIQLFSSSGLDAGDSKYVNIVFFR